MAINQASFFLFAPRYSPTVELDHESKTVDGSPTKIIDSELSQPDADPVVAGEIKPWFERQGFVQSESWGDVVVLAAGFTQTFLGKQENITLTIPLDPDEEIDCLYIRFLLTNDAPMPVSSWESLIIRLEAEFKFKLMTPDIDLTNCVDFRTMLELNDNYRMFTKTNN